MIEDFGHILDEHLNRVSNIHRVLFYTYEQNMGTFPLYENEPLNSFLKNEQEKEHSSYDFKRLQELTHALKEESQKFPEVRQTGDKQAELSLFEDFDRLSNELITRLHRMEQDLAREGSGIDPLTGLRNQSILHEDLERELSACARRNGYACVALGRIDYYDKLIEAVGSTEDKEFQDAIINVANIIKRAMRLYDDAYRLSDGQFFISFKHTDKMGAISAVERFVSIIKRDDINNGFPLNKITEPISLSFVVAKLEAKEEINALMGHLKRDLDENGDERSLILEYHEKSELEKYAKKFP